MQTLYDISFRDGQANPDHSSLSLTQAPSLRLANEYTSTQAPKDAGSFDHEPPISLPPTLPQDAREDPPRSPVKKALLIGIVYKPLKKVKKKPKLMPSMGSLRGPHKDVSAMKDLLLHTYEYKLEDITILIDAAGHPPETQPTRVNMIREIKNLVKDAQVGDTFLLHYCGHAIQIPNRSKTEEDEMDECLVPVDATLEESSLIIDNDLRRWLIDPLPAGSNFIVRFSVLDL
ncbi:hypothetical protein ONZ45_g14828 [Pleurotus djamor]|nr:hypothetical protein ONZ45_g14828 [Pleurotus djamor]